MKTYKVLRQCHGFKRRMWQKDQIVTLEDNETPPYHFKLIDAVEVPKVKEPEPDKPIPLSAMGEIPPVIGGFGASIDPRGNLQTPNKTVKRGRPKRAV